jgi:hypothetical protein
MPEPNRDSSGSNRSRSARPSYGQFEHLDTRVLKIGELASRGRLLRDRASSLMRFVVNSQRSGEVPDGWPHKEEWVVTERELTG